MNTVSGRCTTNLDSHRREEWPGIFCRAPQLGERVAAKSGKWLRVVGITHMVTIVEGDPVPYLEIELHH